MPPQSSHTTCCIVGGGPAGVMTGYLLARSGVGVIVLEKHKDFFRDFRGDTVHPSTLQVFHELGLLQQFLEIPHQEVPFIDGNFGGYTFRTADFRHLPTKCKFVALMPQWDLLNFLAEQGKKFRGFEIKMEHEAIGLVRRNGRIGGVEIRTPTGSEQITADLVIGCDGRHSIVRQAAKMEVIELGVPIDVLWFRIGRKSSDPENSLGNINYGKVLVLINRNDYYQAGLIIPKGSFEKIRQNGLSAFQQQIVSIAPWLADRVSELKDWDQIKLLSVQINRVKQWHQPGLLCIGDAAHAMSPAGGVGINLAIQDAVATANLIAGPLREKTMSEDLSARLQERRELPVRLTQGMQVRAHGGMAAIFRNTGPAKAPWQLKFVVNLPGLPRFMGRAIGMGVRPEHVHTRVVV